ncbi:type II secretion system protein GspM [Aliikangiella maris]|uniref:Type II secretion system protein M n=2 Tax=Aliikangiella maris TaxID=3162458 RepID=A0ABV3MTE2_9GAMM
MEQLKQWYNGLDSSEQRLVNIASIFVVLFILFFGILKPISDSVESIEGQIQSRERSVALWKKSMPQIIANRGAMSSSNSNIPLTNLVTSTTRQYQLNVSRVKEKSPNEMQVWFDNVSFNDFIRWVAELESRHKVSVDSVNIRTKDRDGLSSIDIKIQRG